ncbi:hypothetical protein GBK02_09260 [Dechloromonas sp. TW-R-39-2]|uniref:hypothetical protein n=1 Tax=Dechloromonas sp. TW-R-39-2 TaxID=2654218 RepID=UPI00193D258F|nr:hypothetical protein [Dechloromonas sp. TW-R-39-2]QRM19577.1 hypothetical protein GBK02_09260 [Dechloromonas sp. TW-R-39-2]
MKNTLLLASIVVTLFGCASQPMSNDESSHIPAEQRINGRLFISSPGTSEVTIKRDNSFGVPCSTKVFIDGAPVADIYKTEKAVVWLPPGAYILSAKTNGICGIKTGIVETGMTIKLGEKRSFRISLSGGGELNLTPTAF